MVACKSLHLRVITHPPAGRQGTRGAAEVTADKLLSAWQGSSGVQPVVRQVWAAASRAVDGLVDVAEDYVPENVSRGTVRCRIRESAWIFWHSCLIDLPAAT